MRKTFKYRLYPSHKQERLLQGQLEEARWLYNHLLEERKTAWEERQTSLSLYDQEAELPALKVARPTLKQVHSQVLQNVAVRIDLAMQAFFRRVKAGETPGYPRFRGPDRYDSLTFPQTPGGAKLHDHHLTAFKIGDLKCVVHRPLEGTPKTVTLRRTATGKWFVAISCEWTPTPLPPTDQAVGIDMGLTTFATLSTGATIANPRFFRHEEQALARAQRQLAKEEKGTPNRAQRRKVVARVYERMTWRREDFSHQQSRRIVNQFDVIAVEDLRINQLVHTHCLAKSIHDVAWGQFFDLVGVKADPAWAGTGRTDLPGGESRVHVAELFGLWASQDRPDAGGSDLHLCLLRPGAGSGCERRAQYFGRGATRPGLVPSSPPFLTGGVVTQCPFTFRTLWEDRAWPLG